LLIGVLSIVPLAGQTPGQNINAAGYEQQRIRDESRDRPIQLDIWYPASSPEQEHIYGISKGTVAAGAPVAGTRLPIVLLSHGAMGAASNYSWLAEYLARRGYIVLGVSHFRESPVFGSDTIDPASVSRFDERVKDLNFALDYLIDRSKFSASIDADRIALIGHSSGGASILMMSGVPFSAQLLGEYCKKNSSGNDKGCLYPRSGKVGELSIPPSTRAFRAIVAMDPAVGPGFTKDALRTLKIPTLIIGSMKDDFLPFGPHAGYIANEIKDSKLIKLDKDAGHFVFLDVCNLPINVMGVPLCSDTRDIDRESIHKTLAANILQFLDRKMKTP
jgi:predicted dienelactone hydrolase